MKLDRVYLGTVHCLVSSLVGLGANWRAEQGKDTGNYGSEFLDKPGDGKKMGLGHSKLYACSSKFLVLGNIRPLKSLNLS